MQKKIIILAITLWGLIAPVVAIARPTVIELYTSQGCSSCPPAEAIIRQMSQDPAYLALSFHVHYFDYMGWKDPFASTANTARQRAYMSELGLDTVYTPQVIVDGAIAVVGSDNRAIASAVAKAKSHATDIPIAITPQSDGNLRIAIAQVPPDSVAWELHFNRGGVTDIQAGENGGTKLESTNNVMRYVPMPLEAGRENDFILPGNSPEDGVAIILQQKPLGRIIGAASYLKPVAQQALN